MKKQTTFIDDLPPLQGEDRPAGEVCAKIGCNETGEFKAPRTPHDVRDYIWFCLDHVREYNKSWNYFEGLDELGMEDAIRSSTTWERPSWKFGTSARSPNARWYDQLDDPLGALGGDAKGETNTTSAPPLSADEKKAWTVIGLSPYTDQACVKKRYKELVKTHHPDANGGSRKAEDRLKTINWAYAVLKKHFSSDLP
jgi:hypothetical protein